MSAAMVINGRIDRPGDRDVFRFDCGRGDQIVAEVYARRLNSPLDSVLKVTDAGGRTVVANDDNEDKASALATHHADSRVSFRVLVAGAYYFHLGDTQKKGGPTYAYRLRISPERPDFELRVVPASINARAGANVPISVYALRRDGFAGEIALELKDPPQGLRFSGLRMPAGQDRVRATLTMPTTLKDGPVELRMEGYARIGGKEVRRMAVPAEDMMQAFAYHQLVPAEKWLITGVRDSRFTAPPVKPLREEIVKLRAGGTARVALTGARSYQDAELQFELSEPPDGITIQKVSVDRDGTQIVLSADAKAVKPGLKGNLIVEAFIERGGGKGGNTQRVPVGTLPAIPFEIVAL
jgi:hypothetical protein